MTNRPPSKKELEKLRNQADEAIKWGSRLLDSLLFAEAELVQLTYMHMPDDFNYCPVCKKPFPCPTADAVKKIALLVADRVEKPPNNGDEDDDS